MATFADLASKLSAFIATQRAENAAIRKSLQEIASKVGVSLREERVNSMTTTTDLESQLSAFIAVQQTENEALQKSLREAASVHPVIASGIMKSTSEPESISSQREEHVNPIKQHLLPREKLGFKLDLVACPFSGEQLQKASSRRVPLQFPTVADVYEQCFKAPSGWGTNEDLIISILGHRNAAQRKTNRQVYAETDGVGFYEDKIFQKRTKREKLESMRRDDTESAYALDSLIPDALLDGAHLASGHLPSSRIVTVVSSSSKTNSAPPHSGLGLAVVRATPLHREKPCLGVSVTETKPLTQIEFSRKLKELTAYTLEIKPSEIQNKDAGEGLFLEWWKQLRLNERFATCVKIWTQFLDESNERLRLDGLAESHHIEVDISHADINHTGEIFDAISYKKGASVILMLQSDLDVENFQKALASYIKRYACSNAKTEGLWTVLEDEFRKIHGISTGSSLISVLLGSRLQEVAPDKDAEKYICTVVCDWSIPVILVQGKAECFLFEDDGDGYGYEFTKGDYLLTTHVAERQSPVVTVKVLKTEGSQLLLWKTAKIDAWGIDGKVVQISVPAEQELTDIVRAVEERFQVHLEAAAYIPDLDAFSEHDGYEEYSRMEYRSAGCSEQYSIINHNLELAEETEMMMLGMERKDVMSKKFSIYNFQTSALERLTAAMRSRFLLWRLLLLLSSRFVVFRSVLLVLCMIFQTTRLRSSVFLKA